MSFEQNYGIKDPSIEEEETIFSKEEILQMQIEEHLEFEEAEIEEIKETYRGFISNERKTSKAK